MNLTKKGNRNNHRGVIGIESAIVMIAFVIVAAALSFVVLNMGFSTTQKAKSAITSGLEEVAGSLEISGDVLGVGQVTTGKLNATSVPIAVASDGAVNLDPTSTTVTYLASGIQYNNIYGAGCMLNSTTYSDLSTAMTAAVTKGCINSNPVTGGAAQTNTKAVVYFTTQKNTNSVVESGEVEIGRAHV